MEVIALIESVLFIILSALGITLSFLIPLFFYSVYYLIRLKKRNESMQQLAQSYGLNFHDKLPRFRRIFLRNLTPYPADEDINQLDGYINNHKIYISDRLLMFYSRRTIIEIDGERVKESLLVYWLNSIGGLKKLLDELKKK